MIPGLCSITGSKAPTTLYSLELTPKTGVRSLKAKSESDPKSKKSWATVVRPDCPEPTSRSSSGEIPFRRVGKKEWKGKIKTNLEQVVI